MQGPRSKAATRNGGYEGKVVDQTGEVVEDYVEYARYSNNSDRSIAVTTTKPSNTEQKPAITVNFSEHTKDTTVTHHLNVNASADHTKTIKLYYCSQMTSNYNNEKKIMRDIIKQNIKPANQNDTVNLSIYCKT